MISHLKGSLAASLAALVAAGALVSTIAVAAADQTSTTTTAATEGDCGTIDTATAGSAQVSAAATCFQQAFSSCKAAQLRATWESQTETVERDIYVSPGDYSCMIIESVSHTPKATGTDTDSEFRCAGASATQGGLVIRSCGADGDVRIEAAAH